MVERAFQILVILDHGGDDIPPAIAGLEFDAVEEGLLTDRSHLTVDDFLQIPVCSFAHPVVGRGDHGHNACVVSVHHHVDVRLGQQCVELLKHRKQTLAHVVVVDEHAVSGQLQGLVEPQSWVGDDDFRGPAIDVRLPSQTAVEGVESAVDFGDEGIAVHLKQPFKLSLGDGVWQALILEHREGLGE